MAEGTKLFEGHVEIKVDPQKQAQQGMAAAESAVRDGTQKIQQSTSAASKGLDSVGVASRNTGGRVGSMGRVFLEASRGAEDFAVQLGPMGIGGALRGASNNISQMFALISPLAGAFAGVAIAGSFLVSAFMRGSTEADKLAESVDNLGDRLDALARRTRLGFEIEDFISAGAVDEIEKEIRSRERLLKEQEQRRDESADTRRLRLNEFLSTLDLPEQLKIGRALAEVQGPVPGGAEGIQASRRAFAEAQAGRVGIPAIEEALGKTGNLEEFRKRVEDANKEFAKAADEIRALKEQIQQLRDAAGEAARRRDEAGPAFGGAAAGAGFAGAGAAALAERIRAQEKFDRDLEVLDPENVVARAKRIQAETEEAIRKLRKAGVDDPEREAALRRVQSERIEALARDPRGRESRQQFTGITDLSKQIQLALNPDRATKAAEKSAAELEAANKMLKQIADNTKNANQVAVVAPGN